MDQNNSNDLCNSYCPSAFNSTFINSNGLFLVSVSLNIRSFNTNGDSFLNYIDKINHPPDVIVLSEKYLSDTYISNIPGFRSFNSYSSINYYFEFIAIIRLTYICSIFFLNSY